MGFERTGAGGEQLGAEQLGGEQLGAAQLGGEQGREGRAQAGPGGEQAARDDPAAPPCAGRVDPLYAERFPLLDGIPAPSLAAPPDTPEQAARRARYDAPFGPVNLPRVRVTDAVAHGPHGPIPLRVYRPLSTAPARPGLVWLHGGAWFFGDLAMPESDHVARRVAAAAGAVVITVDYRLALGGVHFPVPHDDCWAAYLWTLENVRALGLDPGRIAVGGGSAGGNLAAGVALRARDEGTPPAQVLLAYPACHPGAVPASAELLAAAALIPPALRFGADDTITQNYLGGPASTATPYAFPGVADSLAGFPPTYIENCEFDTLRASGEEFARQLTAAGVAVELVTACGVPHGHLNRVGDPSALATCERLARRLRQR